MYKNRVAYNCGGFHGRLQSGMPSPLAQSFTEELVYAGGRYPGYNGNISRASPATDVTTTATTATTV